MFDVIRDTIRRIPKGKVSTYGDVARAAGFPGASRQVVWALQDSRGLPWHRVVGAGGKILLRGESALDQRFRLEAEGVIFHGSRIHMEAHQFNWPKRTRGSGKRAAKSGSARA
jgi:methylated-DNA-protein-cysteine methyltransferase-like protein